MVRETLRCVKQVGYMLSEREIIKNGDIFVKEKWWLTLSYSWLFLDGKKGKIVWIQGMKKKFVKKELWEKNFYTFRVKVILNLVRWRIFLNVNWCKTDFALFSICLENKVFLEYWSDFDNREF